ncbi:MAG: hypothetical protein KBS81_11355 [Spirochaetales bacterium]|nr:hypothetical protein [Candidatus Physcosoma equi]
MTAFAFASTDANTVFMWNKVDPDVNYFRYSMDGGEWITVGAEQRDSILSYVKDEDHFFTIQQSYDGKHWGEPIDVVFSSKPEEVVKEKKQYSCLSMSAVFVPFETYITTKTSEPDLNERRNRRDYQSIYAAGLELNAIGYVQENLGFGAAVEGTFAYIGMSSRNTSFNFSAYGLAAFRLVSHPSFEVVVETGFGAQFESIKGKMFTSPSVLLQADASLHVYENLSVSVTPSFSYSFGDYDFRAYNIRAIGVGVKYSI